MYKSTYLVDELRCLSHARFGDLHIQWVTDLLVWDRSPEFLQLCLLCYDCALKILQFAQLSRKYQGYIADPPSSSHMGGRDLWKTTNPVYKVHHLCGRNDWQIVLKIISYNLFSNFCYSSLNNCSGKKSSRQNPPLPFDICLLKCGSSQCRIKTNVLF